MVYIVIGFFVVFAVRATQWLMQFFYHEALSSLEFEFHPMQFRHTTLRHITVSNFHTLCDNNIVLICCMLVWIKLREMLKDESAVFLNHSCQMCRSWYQCKEL